MNPINPESSEEWLFYWKAEGKLENAVAISINTEDCVQPVPPPLEVCAEFQHAYADGKMTGYRVSHRIQDGGAFDEACRALLDNGLQINCGDRIVRPRAKGEPPQKAAKKDRIKFTCQTCGLNAWAKPTVRLECGTCKAPLKRSAVLA